MAIGTTGLISGCAVTPVSTMTINVAAGTAQFGGNAVTVASQNLVVATASVGDRLDVVGIDSTGTARIATGTGLVSKPAALGDQGTTLAEIHVVGGITTVLARHIIDRRSFIRAAELTGNSYLNGAVEVTGAMLVDSTVNAGYIDVWYESTFTETTGAGTYTVNVPIPAGGTLIDIQLRSTSLWTATTSATMNVGDTANGAGTWYTTINLKATDLLVGEVIRFNSTGGREGTSIVVATGFLRSYYAAADSVLATVLTVGGSGNAGVTRMLVGISVPLTRTVATKV